MKVFLTEKKFELNLVKDNVDISEPNRTLIFGLSGKKHHWKFWVKFCY